MRRSEMIAPRGGCETPMYSGRSAQLSPYGASPTVSEVTSHPRSFRADVLSAADPWLWVARSGGLEGVSPPHMMARAAAAATARRPTAQRARSVTLYLRMRQVCRSRCGAPTVVPNPG